MRTLDITNKTFGKYANFMKDHGFNVVAGHFRTDDKVITMLIDGFGKGQNDSKIKSEFERLILKHTQMKKRYGKALDKLTEILGPEMKEFRKELDSVK